ncbi:hypothetical protein A4U94_03690 [Prescottella equi]|uniref:hypothetical protein n=1 Tax=Rhodococcus hoagii TaxID=43767 RepID=UPI0009C13E5E|nr:hypothetical protein [Prescottella equi]OQQ29128.1 hypothetical protein A4U94_03690 [Prescottella equi]
MSFLRGLGWIVRVAIALLGLVLVVTQSLITAKIWENPNPRVVLGLAIGVGVAAFSDQVFAAISKRRAVKREGRERRIEKTVAEALSLIAWDRKPRHNMALLGVSVFEVQWRLGWRRGPLPWALLPWPEEGLKRVVRFRLSDTPQASKVDWVKGKGCIGAAWETRLPHHMDWRPIARARGDGRLTPEQFEKMSKEAKSNFTYDEFRGIAPKYAEILAVPILSDLDGKVLGIVSFDRPMEDDEDPDAILDTKLAKGYANGAARILRDLV